MNNWDWRACSHLMPGLAYNLNERRMAFPTDKPEDCYDYDGCSLSLLAPPANSCHYVTCYGEKSCMECGTHRQLRLQERQERMGAGERGTKEARLRKAEQAITGLLGDPPSPSVEHHKSEGEKSS